MKLLIRQRFFSWTDSFDIYDEAGQARYEVHGELFSWGHRLHVRDKRTGREIGMIREKILTLLPRFEIDIDGRCIGSVAKEFTLFVPRYRVDCLGWEVTGDLLGWDYQVTRNGRAILQISKELLHWTDTYVLDFADPEDEIPGLMLVLAIDAANCDE